MAMYVKLSRHLWRPKNDLGPIANQGFRYASSETSKRTCLHKFHENLQARMELFAGYIMPIVYKNQTIKSEHIQTRNQASVFDVSHMMQTIVRGKDRVRFIESLTVSDIHNLGNKKCSLSVFTNDSGGVIDDCIIAKNENHLHIVSNAGNSDIVWSWLNERKLRNLDVHLERLDGRGLIALQGPKSSLVLQRLIEVDLNEIEFMNTFEAEVKGIGSCIITRCGYTGEDGFEISVDPSAAMNLMQLFCQNDLVKPAGLGARDTLRLEAGLCLHGNDLTDKITPVEAALNWTIHKRRRIEGGFPGSNIILEQLKQGSSKRRTGIVAMGGGPPARHGCQITDEGGETIIGEVTSGTFAPVSNKNIAMAYLPVDVSKNIGQIVYCRVRDKAYKYEVTKMPFVKSNYYIPKSRS